MDDNANPVLYAFNKTLIAFVKTLRKETALKPLVSAAYKVIDRCSLVHRARFWEQVREDPAGFARFAAAGGRGPDASAWMSKKPFAGGSDLGAWAGLSQRPAYFWKGMLHLELFAVLHGSCDGNDECFRHAVAVLTKIHGGSVPTEDDLDCVIDPDALTVLKCLSEYPDPCPGPDVPAPQQRQQQQQQPPATDKPAFLMEFMKELEADMPQLGQMQSMEDAMNFFSENPEIVQKLLVKTCAKLGIPLNDEFMKSATDMPILKMAMKAMKMMNKRGARAHAHAHAHAHAPAPAPVPGQGPGAGAGSRGASTTVRDRLAKKVAERRSA